MVLLLVGGCVGRAIRRNKLTYEQLSLLLCWLLMRNIRVGVWVEIAGVTPVESFEVKTVLGSPETRAGGLLESRRRNERSTDRPTAEGEQGGPYPPPFPPSTSSQGLTQQQEGCTD